MQRLRRVGETSGAFARVLLPEKLLIHTERCEMRRDLCVLAGICVLLAAPAAMSQSDPQRPAESPSQQMTVPQAQQPPQQRQRTQQPGEQQPAQQEGAQAKPAQHPPIAEEKAALTHHSARIGGQEIKYNARSEEHTSELQSRLHIACRLL